MNGWIKLHRNIVNNWVYEDAEYLKIWITFLVDATHTTYKKLIGNSILVLKPGQFIFGRKKYSEKLNITEWKLRKAIELFVQDEMIKVVKRTNKYTIYEIVNYSLYQHQERQQETANSSELEQAARQQATSNVIENTSIRPSKYQKNHQQETLKFTGLQQLQHQQTASKPPANRQQAATIQEHKNIINSNVCMYSENLKNIVQLLEENIGVIPPIWIDEVSEYSKIFDVKMFGEAIKIASNNKRRHVKYVLGILRNWKDANIITIDDLEAFRREKEMERQEKQQNQNKQYTPKKNRFHNFEQRTDKYSAEQLEEIARRKREEYYKKLQGGI